MEIDFRSESIPAELSEEISLSLFRVLQEAVQNAAKHSGSGHFQVSIRGGSNEIELKVHDAGIGFEPEVAFAEEGLGLTSMRERLKLVNGELSIESGCSAEQPFVLACPTAPIRNPSKQLNKLEHNSPLECGCGA